MELKNIKRNTLDYILTDILPVELSELFTFRHYYEFLQDNSKILKNELKILIQLKNNTDKSIKLFENKAVWASMPYKFNISKGENSFRQMNVLQPIAALEIFYFVGAYQEELLSHLNKNSIFSLRYHNKSNSLFYKNRKKNITQYFNRTSGEFSKRILEQTGRYFDLAPYTSIVGFTNSDEWFDLNLKYKYFARIDYKSCFDSIYSHTYKWLISRDVNDSIKFKNTNVFTTIDRIIQNINALSSNGLVVGPEFSRMIAEVLLQHIDVNVYSSLLNKDYIFGKNYSIRRYVDDIFIFSESEELREEIIGLFENISQKYLLFVNENKINKEKLPFILTSWLSEISNYSTNLSNTLFYTQNEINQKDSSQDIHWFKSNTMFMIRTVLKRNFNDLVSKHSSEKTKLVSYVLGTILNKVSIIKSKSEYNIFRSSVSDGNLFEILDYIFYIYSHATTFDNTQKLISIISYINDDIDLITLKHLVLQKIINKYAFIFTCSNSNDIINLLVLCIDSNLEIPYEFEMELENLLFKSENPITLATFLVYSGYNSEFFSNINNEINQLIKIKVESIRNHKSILNYKEFWWLIIFNKSPYLFSDVQALFDTLLSDLELNIPNIDFGNRSFELYIKFLKENKQQFFCWDVKNRTLIKEITYRTYERTIFRNYKFGQTAYTSIE